MARTAGTGPRPTTRSRRRWYVLRGTSSKWRYPTPFADDQSDGEDGDDDDDDRAFSQINALSSPASTPPQAEFPASPDLSEKINGPSTSTITTIEPLRLLRSPSELDHTLSHRTSCSTDDVEAELMPGSPTPSSVNTSQNANSNQGNSQYLDPFNPSPPQSQTQFPSVNVNRFRRGIFQVLPLPQRSPHSGFGLSAPQSQTLRSPDNSQLSASASQSQTNGNSMSWLNTQAFRPPETQDSYDSD